ncbi:hypothetical protein QFC22_004808 [Naganishia vaughanmartiniae]|uniref:Uncharacterized protein n=1 Tax=Naganishia vaughanmartiniae TaxID=1424756 RepID=A0ACC2WZA7_9TREE|nr:hypothetical protein QFC22_004808 [Naganishia vaughanmartiniae]
MHAARNGFEFYKQIQADDGHWAGAYGGPLFLIPGLVIGMYVMGISLRPEQKIEMIRYLLRKRRKEGGWGLHTAAPPTTFGTVMNYVSLRILGLSPDMPVMAETRAWIHKMDIPLGYLYGRKFKGPLTPLVEAIRSEIYIQPYDTIDFSQHRNNIHPVDIYNPHHPILDVLNSVLATYEHCAFPPLRRKGLEAAYKLVVYEDENTGYQTVGPVSKMLNMVCRFAEEGAESEAFQQHLGKIDDFLWMSEEGLMMTGTNGSQLWDIAFISQALVETGLAEEEANQTSCLKALDWLDKAQIRDDPKWYNEAYRHRSKGAWPFSTPEQSYTVSDCAGEGMKAVLALQSLSYTPKAVVEQRLKDCADLLLTMQNPNGGFASYELVRGSCKLEWLNTAEVFGDIMIEYTYPDRTLRKAIQYVHNVQKPDGSWHGSWGICFTYATMFALESLSLAGETYNNSASVRKACEFLVKHQMEDGGWGETYMASLLHL